MRDQKSAAIPQKKIFISYAHTDAAIARQMSEALASVGLEPWIDTAEIKLGESFLERMSEGIEQASYVLALISQASHSSRWVTREWMSSLANRDTVFIPVLLDDAPVPALVRDILYIDLRGDTRKGIAELVSFFLLERSGGVDKQQQQQQQQQQEQRRDDDRSWSSDRDAPRQQQQQQQQQQGLRGADRRQIRLVARRCMDDDTSLRAYCFDAEIEFSRLGGGGVEDKLLMLLHELDQRSDLERFVNWLENEKARCVSAQIAVLSRDPAWNWSSSAR